MFSNSSNKIMVTGIGGPAGYATAKYLSQKGYSVIGTDMREIDTDLDVDSIYIVPAANDPQFISALIMIIRELKIGLLIPTVSEELPIVAKEKSSFIDQGCNVVIASYEAVIIANDKLTTVNELSLKKIPVPKTLNGEISHEEIIDLLGLPVLSKPRISRGGRDVSIYGSADDLAEVWGRGIIFQEFVSGLEYDVNIYIDRQGIVRASKPLLKTRLKQGMVGNALSVKEVENEEIALLAQQACLAIGLIGPASVDIRLDDNKHPRILEINARLGANNIMTPEVIEALLVDW